MDNSGSRVLITGGAGFIGRWVVAELLEAGHRVRAFDDCSSGSRANLAEFEHHPGFEGLTVGDVKDRPAVESLFADPVDVCLHLAARINVQQSIDTPQSVLENDVIGTFNLLEAARAQHSRRGAPSPKVVFVSTCMVYATGGDQAGTGKIDEAHPVQARSPYAACKLAGEHLALSYFHAYGLPVTVLRPFNTYGPYQRTDTEGGVVSVFLQRALTGQPLLVRGDGRQTRDLLYVKDCARFIIQAALNPASNGLILNAGTGADISICDLARRIVGEQGDIRHVSHDHPQAEIPKLLCDPSAARRVLGWRPVYDLQRGLAETKAWVRQTSQETAPTC
ncbi:MAG: NAD-dependent epimerase/dehydratase family protein [bacterium]|nr:NAD-dependent epimerase/dehydratase family protein [bacterium]